MTQNGLTGVPVVKIVSVILHNNAYLQLLYIKRPIYMNFTKKRYSLKTTTKIITEKGRTKSDGAVISN